MLNNVNLPWISETSYAKKGTACLDVQHNQAPLIYGKSTRAAATKLLQFCV